jgi:hypothetical protein
VSPDQAIRASELSDLDLPDHIAIYLATMPVTLPQWIGMQDFWRGGDAYQEHYAELQMTRRKTTELEDR